MAMRSLSSENWLTGSRTAPLIITPFTQWPAASLVIDNANRHASLPSHDTVTSSEAGPTRSSTRPVGHSRGSSSSSTDDFR